LFFSFTFVTVLQSAAVRLRFDTKQKCKTNTEDLADFSKKVFLFHKNRKIQSGSKLKKTIFIKTVKMA